MGHTRLFLARTIVVLVLVASATSQLTALPVCKNCASRTDFCITDEECGCDADCEIFKDCCTGWRECDPGREPSVSGPYPPFQCHDITVSEPNPSYIWMVSECPPGWSDQVVEDNCVLDRSDRSFPPVTDVRTGFVYRNEFCAACNGIVDLAVWGYELECGHELQTLIQNDPSFVVTLEVLSQYCNIEHFVSPDRNNVYVRPCYPSIAQCLPMSQLVNLTISEYENFRNRCENDVIQQLVYSLDQYPYRNQYCSLCNNFSIFCFRIPPSREGSLGVPLPFSATLDILGDGRIVVSSLVVSTNITVTCSESEVYDPVRKECRQTLLCDGVSIGSCEVANAECNGSLLNLTRSEDSFTYLNSSTVVYQEQVYTIEFNTSDGDPVICVNFSRTGSEEGNTTVLIYGYPPAFFILTYIGCSLSVIGSALVILTYTIFKELRTLPSKILMNLAFAILVTNLLILLGGPIVAAFPDVVDLCVATGVLLHFFFLSQFSWMSVLSLEMARIFFQASRLESVASKTRKCVLLLLYLFVGWSVPLLITTTTVVVNYTRDGLVLYGVLPDGSRGSCWINHLESAVVAFVIPLAMSLIFNTITFTVISVLLCKASRVQAKFNKEGNISYLRVNVAVFSTSGLTWIFGFLAILVGTSWSWYPFIILNSTQGFIIFLAFLCTKRVTKLYIEMITVPCTGKEKVTTNTNDKPSQSTIIMHIQKNSKAFQSVAELDSEHGGTSTIM